MKKQTAVEWLIEQIFQHNNLVKGDGWFYVKPDIIEQAKAMEKEQISKFLTINIESATGQDLGKVTYIPLPNIDYVPKQETLEEAAIINCESITHPYCDREKSMFIKGAEWQAERMYSEEDMKNAFDSAREFNSLDGIVDVHIVLPMGGDMSDLQPLHFTFEEWFEQFKKK